ncbi:MAG: DNA-directed RNA polymerase subunit D [Zestosphaera tikiterensis]|uniref:DNA-directed RNA polymerase subunit Rpo3 n=1 Tax=Zestosphaera tikiterensis TaxID=1973259 RepID=A0A2R7Y5R5_9CREN|nr:MAG: DNA-directed RNA polymerase subunit D [Zestosphaera tikiterensis]
MGKFAVEVIEKDEKTVKLKFKGVPLQILNALRRAALEYVPTMAVDLVVFRDNTSVLHDEIIAHRLGLIPLKSDEALNKYKSPEECVDVKPEESLDCYAHLTLEASTGPDEVKDIYSGDLKPVTDPKVRPAYDRIPIVRLGPRQSIALDAYARLGRGVEHIKWSPATISTVTYLAQINVDVSKCNLCGKCVEVCPREALAIEGNVLKTYEDRCIICRQCVRVCPTEAIDVTHKEDEYILTIESSGALRPERIVFEALKIVASKLDMLLSRLELIVKAEVRG